MSVYSAILIHPPLHDSGLKFGCINSVQIKNYYSTPYLVLSHGKWNMKQVRSLLLRSNSPLSKTCTCVILI